MKCLGLVILLVAWTSCGSDSPAGKSDCVDGRAVECPCAGGARGVQTCVDGAFEACVCDAADMGSSDLNDGVDARGDSDVGMRPDMTNATDMSVVPDMTEPEIPIEDVMFGWAGDCSLDRLTINGTRATDYFTTIPAPAPALSLSLRVDGATSYRFRAGNQAVNQDVGPPEISLEAGERLVRLSWEIDDCKGTHTILSMPDDSLTVATMWETPSDSDEFDAGGTDVDLHLLHPNGRWNTAPWDVYWLNPTAEWGEAGGDDDPQLLLDDTDGRGPEIAQLISPSEQSYETGIYYYADNGFGPSQAALWIWIGSELVLRRLAPEFTTATSFWSAGIDLEGRSVSTNALIQGFPGDQ